MQAFGLHFLLEAQVHAEKEQLLLLQLPKKSNPLLNQLFMKVSNDKTSLLASSEYADILQVNEEPILIVQAKTPFIPLSEFKNLFEEVGQWVTKLSITKLIFDKRSLKVFHQPSMQWYCTEWKEKMADQGLSVYRKLLPEDTLFRHSVQVGRDAILRKFPHGKYRKLDIQYVEDLAEAIRH